MCGYYTVEDFDASTGLGRTRLYAAIKNRQLRAKKYGNRTIILAEDRSGIEVVLVEIIDIGAVFSPRLVNHACARRARD
jgi:hypothetical protein